MRLYLSSYRLGNQPQELVKLLRGKKQVGLIFNAADYKPADERASSVQRDLDDMASLGLDGSEVDLRKWFGQKPGLRAELKKYDALWVRGGNVFMLARAFQQSGAGKIIRDLLVKDEIVYAGFSAGIDMLTKHFRGIELVDDPHLLAEGYDHAVVWEGLGLLPYSVAPHYKSDHPETLAIDKTVEYMIDNHMLFVALRDGEAIVRDGDREWVVG